MKIVSRLAVTIKLPFKRLKSFLMAAQRWPHHRGAAAAGH